MEPTTLRFIPAVDGLRAVAILMVMLHHVDVSRRFVGGRAGVDVFFVISGFLITSLLVNEYDNHRRINFAEFYRRRAYRLLPALLVMLGVVVSYVTISGAPPNGRGLGDLFKGTVFAAVYVSNWAAALGQHIPFGLSHLWSLAVEEQFYVLAPLALAVLLPRVSRRVLVTGLLGAGALGFAWRIVLDQAVGVSRDRLKFGLDTHADGLLIGCALGVAFASGVAPKLFEAARAKRAMGPLALVVLAFITTLPAMRGELTWSVTLFSAAGAFALITVLGQREGLHVRVLESVPMQHVGRLSYALYLWNTPCVVYVNERFGAATPLAVRASLSWVLTFVLAEASLRIIEVPAQRMRSRRERVTANYQSVGA